MSLYVSLALVAGLVSNTSEIAVLHQLRTEYQFKTRLNYKELNKASKSKKE